MDWFDAWLRVAVVVWLVWVCWAAAYIVTCKKPRKIKAGGSDVSRVSQKLHGFGVPEGNEPPVPAFLQGLETLVRNVETSPGHLGTLIDIGDRYARGQYPVFRPNTDVAMTCYRMAARSPDGRIAGMAQAKYVELRLSPAPPEDIQGNPIPMGYAARALDAVNQHRKTRGVAQHEYTPVRVPFLGLAPIGPPPRQLPDPDTLQFPEPVFEVVYSPPGDPQNVHDHGVISSMKATVSKLKKVNRKDVLGLSWSPDAARVVAAVKKNATPHSTLGITELEALERVYGRLLQLGPAADARRILDDVLSTGVERGIVVCSTGRISRILGALEGVDPEVQASKPLWAVRDELGTLAVKVREELSDTTGDYDEDLVREAFRQAAEGIYVKGLGMNKKIVQPLIEVYAAGF